MVILEPVPSITMLWMIRGRIVLDKVGHHDPAIVIG